MKDRNGHGDGINGPSVTQAITCRYSVVLLANGTLTIEGFPTNEMLAIWMHEKARQIMQKWFAQQEQEAGKNRIVVPQLVPPQL